MRERAGREGMYCPAVHPELGYLPQYITIAQWRPGAAHRALSLLFSLLLSLIDHRFEPTLRSSHHHLLVHLNPAASPSLPSLLSLLLLTSSPQPPLTFFSRWASREARKATKAQFSA